MLRHSRVLLLFASALLALAAAPALSVPILDQASTLPGSPVAIRTDNDSVAYQDVVVGMTGDLTAIELHVASPLGSTDDVCCVVNVFDGAFTPGASLLGTALYPFPGTPTSAPIPSGWIQLELPTPIAVTVGQTLSLGFIHDNVIELSTGSYAPGLLTVACGIDPCPDVPFGAPGLAAFETVVFSDVDLAFRTFVVPEPGTAMLVGVLAFALARRRRSDATG